MNKDDFEDEKFSSSAPAGYCTEKGCELSAAQAALMSEQNARCPKCGCPPIFDYKKQSGYSKKPLSAR